MFKFISFYPQVNKEETVPNNNILWMCTYKLLGDQIQIPFELLHFLNSCDCPLPLKHYLEQMDYYDLNIEFNSDYQKQYCMYDEDNIILIVNIRALHVNEKKLKIDIPLTLANKLLYLMKLTTEGSLHSEKMQKRILTMMGESDASFVYSDDVMEYLASLEELCEHCMLYECNVMWSQSE